MPPTAPTEISPLSLHDALPVSVLASAVGHRFDVANWLRASLNATQLIGHHVTHTGPAITKDRKSTRLNSSHVAISYAVFCLKKTILRHFGLAGEVEAGYRDK